MWTCIVSTAGTAILLRPCTICGEIKTLEEFSKDRRNKYGRDCRCIECRDENRRFRERRDRHVVQARAAKRRALQKQAIPPWANNALTREKYAESRRLTVETGVRREVDHSVPLNNDLVCGLHWHGNLEVMTAVENHFKSNRYWPDMWNYSKEDLKELAQIRKDMGLT